MRRSCELLWQVSEAVWGYRNRDGAKRVGKQVTSGAKAAVYAALAVLQRWSPSARARAGSV